MLRFNHVQIIRHNGCSGVDIKLPACSVRISQNGSNNKLVGADDNSKSPSRENDIPEHPAEQANLPSPHLKEAGQVTILGLVSCLEMKCY